MNENYLCCWRDAENDPPPDGWRGFLGQEICGKREYLLEAYYKNGVWLDADGDELFVGGTQWLYVTDEPAIPRSQVQAVVNELDAGLLRVETNACNGANTYFADGAIAAYKDALQEIEEHCGVSPVQERGEE